MPQRPLLFWRPPRQFGGDAEPSAPAGLHPRTHRTARRRWRANRRPQVEQRLSEITGPGHRVRVPAKLLGRGPNRGFDARQRLRQREQPRSHPLDIAVDRHRRHVEADRRHGGSRIGPDPRQFQQTRDVTRKTAARRDHFGTGVEVSGPRIVSQTGPKAQDLIQIGRGERLDRGEPAYEGFIVRYDRGDRRLLQHDLAEPDPVRICRCPGSARQGRRRRWRSYHANNARAGKMPKERISDDDTHPGMTKRLAPRPWASAYRGRGSGGHPQRVQPRGAGCGPTHGSMGRNCRTGSRRGHDAAPSEPGNSDDRLLRTGGDGAAAFVHRGARSDQPIPRIAFRAAFALRANHRRRAPQARPRLLPPRRGAGGGLKPWLNWPMDRCRTRWRHWAGPF